jgi:hypothetical protein
MAKMGGSLPIKGYRPDYTLNAVQPFMVDRSCQRITIFKKPFIGVSIIKNVTSTSKTIKSERRKHCREQIHISEGQLR